MRVKEALFMMVKVGRMPETLQLIAGIKNCSINKSAAAFCGFQIRNELHPLGRAAKKLGCWKLSDAISKGKSTCQTLDRPRSGPLYVSWFTPRSSDAASRWRTSPPPACIASRSRCALMRNARIDPMSVISFAIRVELVVHLAVAGSCPALAAYTLGGCRGVQEHAPT